VPGWWPAADEHQEIRDQRCGVQHLLEIVEDQHRRLVGARDACALRQIERGDVRQSERLGDRRRDELGRSRGALGRQLAPPP